MTTFKNELDIPIISEEKKDTVSFSKSLNLLLTSQGRSFGPYINFNKRNPLTIPYSTIKHFKEARDLNARELYLISAERPDTNTATRSTLDLWGFDSYLNYVYTIAELAFLEGLIPVLDLGLLTPGELHKLKEISCKLVVHMFSQNDYATDYSKSPSINQNQEIRMTMLEWAGELNFLVQTVLLSSKNQNVDLIKKNLEKLSTIQDKFNTIHELTILFNPAEPYDHRKDFNHLKKCYDLAKSICSNIHINIKLSHIDLAQNILDLDIKDFGSLSNNIHPCFPKEPLIDFSELNLICEKNKLTLNQRFPIRKPYIESSSYSDKLGQIFDVYRHKLKKHAQN